FRWLAPAAGHPAGIRHLRGHRPCVPCLADTRRPQTWKGKVMTAHADAKTEAAARILAGAWRDGMLLDGLPEQCRPASAAEAHAIQDATLALLGAATGAYKV